MKKPIVLAISVSAALVLIAFQNCGKMANSQLDSSSVSGLSVPYEKIDKQMIVKVKDQSANTQLTAWAADRGLQNLNSADTEAKKNWDASLMSVWGWQSAPSTEEMMAALNSSSMAAGIEYVEPNYLYQASAARAITDIPASEQFLTTGSYTNLLTDLRSKLTPLDLSRPRPVVAVIDSGVDISHQEFVNTDAIWNNPVESSYDDAGVYRGTNQLDDDNNGYIDDVHGFNFLDKNNQIADSTGHGTHCSGIVLGAGQNIFDLSVDGRTNYAQKSKVSIMVLKFIGPNGGSTSDAINAIYYAANNGARVLSNSWGGGAYSRALEDAIAYAYDREIVFVAAAGNTASNNDNTATYPANYRLPNLISVAALTILGDLALFSDYGVSTVDVGAPGVSILSTYPRTATDLASNKYERLSGTSMATPMVSGLAALAIYENRLLKAHQVRNLIISKADPVSSLTGKLIQPGRISPVATILEARITQPATSKPVIAERSPASGSDSSQGSKAGCGLVKAIDETRPPGPPPFALLALLMIPLLLAVRFRFAFGP